MMIAATLVFAVAALLAMQVIARLIATDGVRLLTLLVEGLGGPQPAVEAVRWRRTRA